MSDLSQAPLISHLGWTLIHSLWQGILVGVLYACLSRMLGRTAPQVRYSLALAMLFMFILLPLITFYLAGWNNESLPLTPPAQIEYMATSSTAAHAPLWQTLADRLSPFTAWVVIIWLSGVLLMGVRALWSWRLAASLRRALPFPAAHPWQPLLHELIGKMHVKATVQLIASARAHAPMVMGWLKPVILIPPSAVCGLSWQQAEMILAHELSHIRRHDYLINLLQVMVETLLFYHPVVHWISRDARNQREFCCDDAVMQTCGDRVGYLKALTELEYGRLHATCNVAANGGLLLNRAYRLAYHSEPKERLAGRTAVLLTLSVLVITAALMRSHSIDHSFRSARSMAMMPIRTQFPEARKPQPLEKHPVSDVPIKLAPTRITPTPAMALPKLESLRIIPVVVAAIPLTPPPPSRLDTRLASTNPPSSKLVIIAAQPLPQPAYPYQAWRDDLGGTVQASFRISETGQVKDINTQMVDGPVVLAGAVRAAISAWKFQPVQINNKIISPQLSLRFTFIADSGHRPEGRCVELTGSHVCHWYQVTIQSSLARYASSEIIGATMLSGKGNYSDGAVAVQLANTAEQGPVFCQPGSNGCSVSDSEEHREQIEHDLGQLGAGLIPDF